MVKARNSEKHYLKLEEGSVAMADPAVKRATL
jgi:hypothetical protein